MKLKKWLSTPWRKARIRKRKKIHQDKMFIKELDELEDRLERLIDGAKGRERVGLINDLYRFRMARTLRMSR